MYQNLAEEYDMFMDNVPYAEWAKQITEILNKNEIHDGIVLELGCGTGNMTELMASAGYDMIGLDLSEEMLNIANEKKYVSGHNILYLCQDMREFELYGTVSAVISCCDSLNYILDIKEISKVFSLVNNYLDPGGYFIFDFNTDRKYKEIGNNVIAENRENASFIWENTYYEDTGINQYDVTIFEKIKGDTYRRSNETHVQRGYSINQIKKALEDNDLIYVEHYDISNLENEADGKRVLMVAKLDKNTIKKKIEE